MKILQHSREFRSALCFLPMRIRGADQANLETLALVREQVPQAVASSSRRIELDMDTIARHGILTPRAERSNLADELRVIKRGRRFVLATEMWMRSFSETSSFTDAEGSRRE